MLFVLLDVSSTLTKLSFFHQLYVCIYVYEVSFINRLFKEISHPTYLTFWTMYFECMKDTFNFLDNVGAYL
jgi:hypothetical protein